MIDTVVFDLGGVLIDWNPRYLYKNEFVTEDAMTYFLESICTSDWNEQQDAGRLFSDATSLLVSQFPQYTREISLYYDQWEVMLNGPINETVQLLKEIKLSGRFRLLALTNWSAESFPVAQLKYDFLSNFEGILVSGKEKLKKPDPAIFKLLIGRYHLDVNKTLFVDDNLNNIHSATDLGFHCVFFDNRINAIESIRRMIDL